VLFKVRHSSLVTIGQVTKYQKNLMKSPRDIHCIPKDLTLKGKPV